MSCSTPVISSDYMLRWLLDVNDSNFGNGRMLIVNQNCDHEYIDPTVFFQNLLPSTFLDLTDTPSDYSWFSSYIVRVNSAGTWLEFVDPMTMDFWTDELVSSEAWATPWYLWTVLDVVSWELTLTVSWNNVILWLDAAILASIASDFLWLSDTPNNYSWEEWKIVAVNSTGTWLEFISNTNNRNLWARMYMTSDFHISQSINTSDNTFVINDMPWFEWDPSMQSSFWSADAILIPKTWLYRIVLRGNMWLSKWILAARIFAVSTPPTAIWPMCDVKFWSRDANNWHWAYPFDMVVTYWQSMIYRFEAWTKIYTWGIISTNVWSIWWWVTTWQIDVLHGNVRGSGTDDRWHSLEVSRFSSDY